MIKNLCLLALLCFAALTVSAQEAKAPPPKIVSAGIVNGKAQSLPKPIYPPAALAVRAAGAVNVQVTIDEGGNVISAAAVSGHPLLRAAAVEAAKQARFSPTLLSGQPVKVTGVIVYNFVGDQSTEIKEPLWTLAMFIALVKNADPRLLSALDKDNTGAESLDSILSELTKEIPERFAAQKQLFEKLAAGKGEARREAAGELSAALKNQMQGHEAWQYELGEQLAAVMIETVTFRLAKENPEFQMNETSLRLALQSIRSLTATPPAEVSADFTGKFKQIGAFADRPDLGKAKTMEELLVSIEPLFELFNDEK